MAATISSRKFLEGMYNVVCYLGWIKDFSMSWWIEFLRKLLEDFPKSFKSAFEFRDLKNFFLATNHFQLKFKLLVD